MKLSVAMCTYNGERYLEEQLASIAAQTRLPDELIVCDDCSVDETFSILERFAAKAPFPVRLQSNENTLGSTRNFEKAITLSSGDLIALSDQDDVWIADKLKRMEAEFLRRPDVGLVFTDAQVVDQDLEPLGFNLWEKLGFGKDMRRRVSSGRHALDVLLPGWTVTGATMAFRASLKDLVLEIPTDLNIIHDGWISVMVAAVSNVGFIDEALVKYRQHPRQQIGAPQKDATEDSTQNWIRGVKSAMNRGNSYDQLIEIAERVRQRLLSRANRYDCGDALKSIEARIIHMRARLNLPDRTLKRFTGVMRELVTGRYHRYSRGFFSAAKDLSSNG